MAEVRLKVGADIKDLQKGVQAASNQVQDLAKEVRRSTGINDQYAASAERANRALGSASSGSSAARVALTDLNRVVSDAPFGFVAIQNNIDQLVGSFGRLVTQSGGVKGALGSIAAAFSGPTGLLTIVSLAGSAALLFGDQISEAFNKGGKAAAESQKAFQDATEDLINFNIGGQKFDVDSLEEIETVIAASRKEVERLTAELKSAKDAGAGIGVIFQSTQTTQANYAQYQAAEARRRASEEALQKEQDILNLFEQQRIKAEAVVEARKRLSDIGLGSNVGISAGSATIDGQEIQSAYDLKQIAEEFTQTRLRQIQANVDAADSFQQVTAALEREAQAAIAEIDAADQRLLQSDLEADSINRRAAAMGQFDAQTRLAGGAFVELGAQGVAALTTIALGFEKVQSAADVVKTIVKQMVVQLTVAAAKAAILTALFPGAGAAAGGFGGLFRGFLGIPKLASGGIVNKPTLSLIGEAGPEAVVPLSKLQSVGGGSVKVEPFSVTVRGGDLVLAFQQARQQTARSVGNIPLR